MLSKRIAFLYMQNDLTTVPCLMSFLQRMSQAGYHIDVFALKGTRNRPMIPNVDVYQFRGYYGKNIGLVLFTLIAAITQILLIMSRRICSYQYIVGVHLFGLFVATFIGFILRIRPVYYNLELYFRKELTNLSWKACKLLEICCTKRCRWVITLDKWHVTLLSREHNIPTDRFLVLPNTAIGSAKHHRSSFLHEMYGIDRSKKIVLTMGSRFHESKHRDEILESIGLFPDDYILLVHLGNTFDQIASNEYRYNSKMVIGDQFLPYEKLDELYSSAHVGLVLYQNEDRPGGGRNQKYMGLSSGQFNLFMKCGIPCITTAQPTFKWIFNKFKCGIALSSLAKVDVTLRDIESRYDEFSRNAINCYENILNYDAYFGSLLPKIDRSKDLG